MTQKNLTVILHEKLVTPVFWGFFAGVEDNGRIVCIGLGESRRPGLAAARGLAAGRPAEPGRCLTVILHARRFLAKSGVAMLLVEDNGRFFE